MASRWNRFVSHELGIKCCVADKSSGIQLHRQFAIAQYLYNNITDEDKERLLFDPDTGRWSGYKHPYGFKVRRNEMATVSCILTSTALAQHAGWD
jgi:hypothetical protein